MNDPIHHAADGAHTATVAGGTTPPNAAVAAGDGSLTAAAEPVGVPIVDLINLLAEAIMQYPLGVAFYTLLWFAILTLVVSTAWHIPKWVVAYSGSPQQQQQPQHPQQYQTPAQAQAHPQPQRQRQSHESRQRPNMGETE